MKQKKMCIVVMILVVIWVGFIFYMSSQTAVNSGKISQSVTKTAVLIAEKVKVVKAGTANSEPALKRYDTIIRNTAHVGMYFVLACIIFSALWLLKLGKVKSVILSFAICVSCSIMDEINQMHFTGRNSGGVISDGIEDLFRDAFGICVALAIFFVFRVISELRNKNAHRYCGNVHKL